MSRSGLRLARADVREEAHVLSTDGWLLDMNVRTSHVHVRCPRCGGLVGGLPSTPHGQRWRARIRSAVRTHTRTCRLGTSPP